jgi:hypothetical protein
MIEPDMTIDERLEALTARHEALSQTVELMAAMQRDHEASTSLRFAELAATIRDHEDSANRRLEELEKDRTNMLRAQEKMLSAQSNMMDAIARLANTTAAHDHRISGLEEQR